LNRNHGSLPPAGQNICRLTDGPEIKFVHDAFNARAGIRALRRNFGGSSTFSDKKAVAMAEAETFIRAYLPKDQDAVINVFVRAIRESAIRDYSAAQIDAWAGVDRVDAWSAVDHRLIWVAVVNDLVIGFTDLELSGHLDRMYVHPEHEGRGVASALLNRLEEAGRRKGLTRLFTEASITAKPFFERRGFEVLTSQVVEFRGEKFTNFKMEKHLT
jgi:putative acetyltransferase